MYGSRINVGRLLGISIGFNVSWLFVAGLITWSLATGYFPAILPGLEATAYGLLAAACTLGLYASVLFHEFAHALTARRYGVGTRRITLFIFGGIAELEDEPPTPVAEFVIAVAGPAASFAAALACVVGSGVILASTGSVPASMVLIWISRINVMLAVFNLIPAFPLDGGRVLRSVLWWWRKDLLAATRISSLVGQAFAIGLIGLGVFRVLSTGSLMGGIWFCLIGLFIRNAARATLRQTAWRELLSGEPVSDFMRTDPVVVPRHISIEELMSSYVHAHRLRSFPVVDDFKLLGLVDAETASKTPRGEWSRQSVGTVTEPCSELNTVAPQTDALEALGRMRRGRIARLLVADGGRLVGTLSLGDLAQGLARGG